MEPVTKNLPVIAMRGLNVFPRMNTSFDLERPISVHALERAMENGEEIFLVTQREIGVEQPEEKDLYEIGTVARVTQILRVSDRVLRVMMEGACRARLKRLWQREPFLQAQVELIDEPATSCHSKRTEAMLRQTYASVTEYAELAQKLPDDVYAAILSTNDPGYLADFIAQQLNLRYQDKQDILDELRPLPRLQRMNEILRREIEVTAMEQDIESKVRSRVGKIQKDFVLREQIKVLQNEIGEGGEDEELDEYREKISKAHLSEEVERKLLKDVDKLAKQPFGSAEASVLRNYLDTCMEMPWGEETKERASVDAARKILDRDHYGLEKVKERILELLAVRKLNQDVKGQIICLVGPPGVGKTSFALNLATNAAFAGASVALFSLEMSKTEIAQRLLAANARIGLQEIRSGNIRAEQWPQILEATEQLSKLDIVIDDTPGTTVTEIRAKARRILRGKKLGVVIVDYLQLISPPSGGHRADSRATEVGEMSRGIKIMAKDLEVPVITLSQLNRTVENRTGKRPQLSDLRESGSIEQDADIVALLDRSMNEEEAAREDRPAMGETTFIIAKNRSGALADVPLTFLPGSTKFVEIDKQFRGE